jgi:sarcosine oxidase
MKLALHYPDKETSPDHLQRDVLPDDFHALQYCLDQYFAIQKPTLAATKICMYTNSPDEHFIIDFVPAFDQDVIVATGFSGHGFKFASVIGEILTDLAIRGYTSHAIEFLKFDRFKNQRA